MFIKEILDLIQATHQKTSGLGFDLTDPFQIT